MQSQKTPLHGGRLPFGSDKGRIFALYPEEWNEIKKKKEGLARLIHNHMTADKSKPFMVQVRYGESMTSQSCEKEHSW